MNKFNLHILSFATLLFISLSGAAQIQYNYYDTLRGANSPHRSCYDITFYDLNLTVVPDQKYIEGFNAIHYRAVKAFDTLQLDLFDNYIIDSLTYNDKQIRYRTDSNTIYVIFDDNTQQIDQRGVVKIYYSGQPVEAQNPPWDGGVIWSVDSLNRNWSAVACEGTGASLWWPCKDYLGDEPDSMAINITIPNGQICVSNGVLRAVSESGDYSTFHWFVSNSINNYNATFYIGDYEKITSSYELKSGKKLKLEYYPISYHAAEAKKYFDEQVIPMLKAYEYYFDEYPFLEDGYKIVEAPYWGMEHQSAIAYGNRYIINDFGFDFIIIHESAHEYWGNSISVNDHGEMWIHEAFATYMEALFLEHRDNLTASESYLLTQKSKIRNKKPILGPLSVNYDRWPDADMYYKGSWMLHTLRNSMSDEAWFQIIKDLYQNYKYGHVSTEEVISFINSNTSFNVRPFFDHYLKQLNSPKLHYIYEKISKKKAILKYRWENVNSDFELPITFEYSDSSKNNLLVRSTWQSVELKKVESVTIPDSKYLIEINEELK